ncbi:MAG: peptidase [Cyanobacteria bacterium P01_F01_bin.150]
MFLPIFAFELRYHLRRPTFWLIAVVFLVIGFTDILSKAGAGNAFFFVNSPSQIFQTTIWYTIFGILAASAFVAETFVRDSQFKMESLVLATPVKKKDYLATRFLAAFGIALLAFSSYLPGMILGTLMPGLNLYALGPFRADAYTTSYFMLAMPNLFVVSAIAFAVASRTRSITVTYVGAIALVMLYLASLMMVGADVINYQQYRLWAMLDPFGFYAFEEKTLTWTVHQHNTLMPTLGGTLLWNRLFWLGIGAGVWTWAYRFYRMVLPSKEVGERASRAWILGSKLGSSRSPSPLLDRLLSIPLPPFLSPLLPLSPPPLFPHSFRLLPSVFSHSSTFLHRAAFETRLIIKGRAFQLLTLFGLISLVMAAIGTRSFNYSNPSTDILVHSANIYLDYVLFAIIVIYAAEVVWRDRILRIQPIVDATLISNGALLLAKLAALFAIISLNLLLAMAVMLGYQVLRGYTNFEFPLYGQMLFLEHGSYFYFMATVALFTQVITRHKYAGMAFIVLISLIHIPFDSFGWYHNLYRVGSTNDIEYSLMNGYGRLFVGHLWYSLYWGLFGVILMFLAYTLWPRGVVDGGLIKRWQWGWSQTKGVVKKGLVAIALLFTAVGSWIAYNTTILNTYQPPGKEETAAAIEKKFKQYESLPMPVVKETNVTIELYPDEGYFVADGEYVLENQGDRPIHELHLLTFINLELGDVDYPGATLREAHPEWGYYIYDLAEPMEVGDRQRLAFQTYTPKPQGFRNHVDSDDVYMVYPNDVVSNGTNLYSPFILPFIGYTKMVEHKKAWLRQKLDLPPLDQRMRSHDDPLGQSQSLMVTHLGWSKTTVTIGTSPAQTAVTSGRLMEEWREVDGRGRDRRYFRYKSTTLDRGKFTVFSGRYNVFQNTDYRVPIEIYYHPDHSDNVKLIAEQVGQALEFYEATFGPYPFKQVRVAEFVYYDGMVFSEGGTIGIPEVLVWKSEAVGDGRDHIIDWVTYLLAHAWWEDQLIAADVAGGMTIRESLSAYASTLYQRSTQTPTEIKQARRRLMRQFFRTLGKIDFQEPPLTDIYNELPIARHKGGMILTQIEELIGQDNLLIALRSFLEDHRYQPAPYSTVLDLRDSILAQTPTPKQDIVRELFEQVITYQVGITDAIATPLLDGGFEIELHLDAQKIYTQNLGQQDSVPLDIPVTITLENEAGNIIYDQEHQLNQQYSVVSFEIDQMPSFAAIDPNYILPSSFLQDNRRAVRTEEKSDR